MRFKDRTIQIAALHIIIFFGLSLFFLILSILSICLKFNYKLIALLVVLTIVNVIIDAVFWYFGDYLLEWKFYYEKNKSNFKFK